MNSATAHAKAQALLGMSRDVLDAVTDHLILAESMGRDELNQFIVPPASALTPSR